MNRMIKRSALCLLAATTLAACGGSSKDDPEQMLRVTVTNLTAGQPMSPVLAAVHTGAAGWAAGSSASIALEMLAEGGDASALAVELAAAGGLAEANGSAPIGPGASDSHELSFAADSGALLTVATMLVNTNDAFAGLNAVAVGAMAVGDRISQVLNAWDAGTEANSEAAGTLPGPADGGEGFNAARSDSLDVVRIHAGVVSSADGLATSVLSGMHRFDNPVIRVEVERIR